jgi:hypothetical protein
MSSCEIERMRFSRRIIITLAVAIGLGSVFAAYSILQVMMPHAGLGQNPDQHSTFGQYSNSSKLISVFTSSRDPATVSLIEKYYHLDDYVIGTNSQLFKDLPNVKKIAGGASLPDLTAAMNDSRAKGYKLDFVVYDPEHWNLTPESEKSNIPGSVNVAADLVRSAGYKYGITPDRAYLLDNYQKIDWHKIDYLNLQLQRETANTQDFSGFTADVKKVTDFARLENPNILVFAQLSFRFTDSSNMIRAIDAISDSVNGFVIAYLPSGAIPCKYCSLDGLEAVLDHIYQMR